MQSIPSPQRTRELTSEMFQKLLDRLAADSEIAGEKYEELRHKLIKFFEWRGSYKPDELADETLNRLARKIDEGVEIEKNVFAFALGIARLVFLEFLKHPDSRQVDLDELVLVATPKIHRNSNDNLWIECLRKCMGNVSEENREIIIEYYQDEGSAKITNRKMLATKLGISLNALFSRARRIRDKLELCVTSCVEGKE